MQGNARKSRSRRTHAQADRSTREARRQTRPHDTGRTLHQLTKTIGAEQLDPFRQRLPEDQDPFIRQVFHAAFTSQWACLAPFRDQHGRYPMVKHFLEQGLKNTTLHYALLYGSIPHFILMRDGSSGLNSIPHVQLVIKDKVLRQLRHDIELAPPGRIPDHVFSVVITLAFYDINHDTLHITPPNYPKSPLADYQSMATAGYRKIQPCHVRFMYRFIEERGGLNSITDCPTRGVLGLADLHLATAHLLPPSLDNPYSINPKILNGGFPMDEVASILSGTFGTAFQTLKPTTARQIKPFLALLPLLRNLTVAIDAHRRRSSGACTIGQLVGTANSVQRRLLSLGQTPGGGGSVADLYSTTTTTSPTTATTITQNTAPEPRLKLLHLLRLAALIYSDLVFFPVSFASGVRCNAAAQLYSLLMTTQAQAQVLPTALSAAAAPADNSGPTQHHNTPISILSDEEPALEMYILFMGALGCVPRGRTAADLRRRRPPPTSPRSLSPPLMTTASAAQGQTSAAGTAGDAWMGHDQRRAGDLEAVAVALEGEELGEWFVRRLRGLVDARFDGALSEAVDENEGQNEAAEREGQGQGKKGHMQTKQTRFVEMMQGFLWWDHVMRHPVRDLWEWMYGA